MVGGKLADMAGRAFGLELEGLSAEDREFEVARRFVRFASATTKNAVRSAPTANPQTTARRAAAQAARRFAPGLVSRGNYQNTVVNTYPTDSVAHGSGRRGVWVRRGRRIILFGV
jgi:hypothetical protein